MPSCITAQRQSESPARGKHSFSRGARKKSVINTLGQSRRMAKKNSCAVNQIVLPYTKVVNGAL